MAEWTCDVRWNHLMNKDAKISTRISDHITKKEYGRADTMVYFNDVITCSLTTKRRQQRTHRKERKWRQKMDNCGFVETKKRQIVVLLHCSFHNVNHKNFQSSGKKQLLSVGYLIGFFGDLEEMVFAMLFPLFIWDVLWSPWLTLRTRVRL